MADARTAGLLTRALGSRDPWASVEELAQDPPPQLLAVVQAHYVAADASSQQRRLLAWLLEQIRDEDADRALLSLLAGARGTDAAGLLRAAVGRGIAVPAGELVRLLADDDAREAAIDTAGLSACESAWTLVPLLRRHLDTPNVRGRAAIALGRMRATSCTGDLVARLPQVQGLEHEAFVVGLELMGDPAAIDGLREWLTRAPAEVVWGVHHALARLSGWEPLTPLQADRDAWTDAVRRAWQDFDPAAAAGPRVDDVELLDTCEARLVVGDGRAGIGIDYDPPTPGSPWPRWDKSLRIADQPVYAVGSDCGTCETSLRLLGWPTGPAATLAQQLRHRLADVATLTTDLIDAAAPLLAGLRTGHYLAILVDLDLEQVTDPTDSWCWRRLDRRADNDDQPDPADTPAMHWPGTDHLQLRTPLPGPHPTYGVVLPTRPLDTTSAATIATHARAITAGAHPAAVLLAWIEDRYARAEHPERFLIGVVLDGHHKLLAYAHQHTPARALMLCRIEDSWGPPHDRTQWINETTQPLRVT